MDDNRLNLPADNMFRFLSDTVATIPADAPPGDFGLFLDGYFSRLILRGARPDYSVPATGLPMVPADATMEITTGFLQNPLDN